MNGKSKIVTAEIIRESWRGPFLEMQSEKECVMDNRKNGKLAHAKVNYIYFLDIKLVQWSLFR